MKSSIFDFRFVIHRARVSATAIAPDAGRCGPGRPALRPLPTTDYQLLTTDHGLLTTDSTLAFSLIEILVTVGLLSFIILGLLAVFNQTQRAFTSSMTRTDVLEAGRATMGMVAGELEMAIASRSPDYYLNGLGGVPYRATNFFVEPAPRFVNTFQDLPGNPGVRTNFVQRFFFINKVNQDWMGIGYQVIPDSTNGDVGTLYRFCSTNSRYGTLTLAGDFQNAANIALQNSLTGLPITNLIATGQTKPCSISRIADGIMDFRVHVFATNGFPIAATAPFGKSVTNWYAMGPQGPYTNVANAMVFNLIALNNADPERQVSHCYFMSNAVPGYVELQMGILESGILRHYRGIPVPVAQSQYLSNHVAQLHLFRQRIPIRNVDFSAYPPYQ